MDRDNHSVYTQIEHFIYLRNFKLSRTFLPLIVHKDKKVVFFESIFISITEKEHLDFNSFVLTLHDLYEVLFYLHVSWSIKQNLI